MWLYCSHLLRIMLILGLVIGLHGQVLSWMPNTSKRILPAQPPVVVKLLRIPPPHRLQLPKKPPISNKTKQIQQAKKMPPSLKTTSLKKTIRPVPFSSKPALTPSPINTQAHPEPAKPPMMTRPAAPQRTSMPPVAILPPVPDTQNPPPTYPSLARRREQEGRVLLQVKVDARGQVAIVQVNQSSGFSLLDEAALRAVALWRFKPASQAGKAISAWVKVPIVFKLQE